LPDPRTPTPPNDDIRRCRRCHEDAVLLETTWTPTHFGIASQVQTRDFRCQACGSRFSLRPTAQLVAWLVVGVLLIPTCIGLPVLLVGIWRWRQDAMNPVVTGAAPVERRFRNDRPGRACRVCGQPAHVKRVVKRRHNGIPAGVETPYACEACGHGFTVDSLWASLSHGAATALCALISLGMLAFGTTWAWRLGGGGFFGFMSLVIGGAALWGLSERVRNPVIAE